MANKTKQADKNHNPTGKGGFAEHPENITSRTWKAEDSIPYQYNVFLRMSFEEFLVWQEKHPENSRTVAQQIAYQTMYKASKDLKAVVEVTDRTSGKAPQSMDLTTGGESLNQFSDEQIKRIASRIAERSGSDDNTPS